MPARRRAGFGKVSTAKRYNYFPAINNTAIVTETYSYGGVYPGEVPAGFPDLPGSRESAASRSFL